MVDVMVTSFARYQFGPQAADVVRGVIEALSEAQAAGCRAQRASGMGARFPYGSVWRCKYDLLVEYLRDLPGAEIVPVFPTSYQLVRVAGHEIIPFRLASSLADVPDRPRVASDVLAALAGKRLPAPEAEPTLFDEFENGGLEIEDQIDEVDQAVRTREAEGAAPVFVGFVGNAESDVLLALRWGTARSISPEGVLDWDPESLPVQLAPSPRSAPRALPDPFTKECRPSFDEGDVPDLLVQTRDAGPIPQGLVEPGVGNQAATGTSGLAIDRAPESRQNPAGAHDERADDADA